MNIVSRACLVTSVCSPVRSVHTVTKLFRTVPMVRALWPRTSKAKKCMVAQVVPDYSVGFHNAMSSSRPHHF